jgi:hypothetical protein
MRSRSITMMTLAAVYLVSLDARPVRSGEGQDVPAGARRDSKQARKAIERGLGFLQRDALEWRKERGCATCHHGTMTVWALSEAQSQGYAVSADYLADAVRWTKDQFVPRIRKPRDPREGWNLVSVAGIYLGLMSQNLPVLSRDEIHDVALHLARHQEEDGTWLLPPPANGAPPTWESRETVALLAYLAWEAYVPADPHEAAMIRAGRAKALAWLSTVKPTDSTQATALRLLLDVRMRKTTKDLQAGIDRLMSRQNADGGWSQVANIPSDAYATGQALWALSVAGARHDRPEIGRAVAFLAANQRDDGSWPMTRRTHPGAKAGPFVVPITYFGSAWATIGLVRSVPPPPDTAARRQRAFDAIKGYHGTFAVDETSPDRPVVRVDLRAYQVDDDAVVEFANLLQAFPQLSELQFRSPKITDAGLAQLRSLPGLRKVSLENAAITDAGLTHLYPLTQLQELCLKGTSVTDTGVRGLQKALPAVKVER